MFKASHSIVIQQCRTNFNNYRAAKLPVFWNKFRMLTPDLLPKEQAAVIMSRDHKKAHKYLRLMSQPKDSPYIIVLPDNHENWLTKIKLKSSMHLRNMFVRGIGLHDQKEDILDNGQAVFFEVLKSLRENDFSTLIPYTLGGSRTLQFHRQELNKLNVLQKTAFDIDEDDLMGENGHIITFPHMNGELGSFIHEVSYAHLDANGEATYDNKGEPVIYCLYKLVFGAVYKFETLDNQLSNDKWNDKNSKIYPTREYKFKSIRNVIVELDICQQVKVPRSIPTKLESNRLLYDFHVFSF